MIRIEFSPQAERQIDSALHWWAENRSEAPALLATELEAALADLARYPRLGQRVTGQRLSRVRRVAMQRSRYLLYYRTNDDRIEILALWHQSRGRAPRL